MQIETLQHGEQSFAYTDHAIHLPKEITQQLIDELHTWQKYFPKEDTFVERTYGVPCLVARFDGAIVDGRFRSYEIQGGCGWIGYAGVANPEFKARRDRLMREEWPSFPVLMLQDSPHDDDLWLRRVDRQTALNETGPIMLREGLWGLAWEVQDTLIARSVRAFRNHFDKRYGIGMRWWKTVSAENTDLLPWDEAFVLKPLEGTGSKDVMCWLPDTRRGRATRTQIKETLEAREYMLLQPFIPPNSMEIDGTSFNVIYRPFFGFDPSINDWTPLHGVWTARPAPNLRIHGSSDAISGPLMMES